jgi:chromosome segregation ATPase
MTKISSEQHEALLRELESKGKEIDETARHIQAIKNKLDNTELSEEFFWKLSQIRWDLTASRDEYTDAVAQWKQTQDNLNSFPLRFFQHPQNGSLMG